MDGLGIGYIISKVLVLFKPNEIFFVGMCFSAFHSFTRASSIFREIPLGSRY